MTIIPKSQIVPTNSVSYVDNLGILAGLERLSGETSAEFAERIELAISASRGAEYAGLMNSLALTFGLKMRQAIKINSVDAFDVKVVFGGIVLSTPNEVLSVDLLRISDDNFWEWKKISQVVDEMNRSAAFTAEMTGPDGMAFELVSQSNTVLVSGETLNGSRTERLQHGRLVAGSEVFNAPVPVYTVGADGRTLYFEAPCPPDTKVTYRYRACPYSMVASPVSVIRMMDSEFAKWAVGSNGNMIYQVREYVQEVMSKDRSYWGK